MKPRKSRVKIIAIVLAALSVGGYFAAQYYLNRRVMNWREEGIAASKSGDHEKAADLLSRYLKRRNGDVDAMTFFIKSREQAELPNGQHMAQTIAALKTLVGLEPERLDERRHLLELYVRFDRRPEALDEANAILAKHPQDSATLDLKTRVLISMNQYRDALETAQNWAAAAPLDLQAHMSQLLMHARLGHPSEVIIEYARKLRDAHPGDPRFELLQGYAYAQTNDNAQAAVWLKTASRHSGLQPDFVKILVEQMDNVGLCAESMAVLEDMAKNNGSADLRDILGRRFWESGNWEKSAAAFQIDPGDARCDTTLMALKTISCLRAKRTADGEALRRTVAARNTSAARAWTLLLRRAADDADIDDKLAVSTCQAALMLDPRNSYLQYFLGDAYARLGEHDLAMQAWRQSASANPNWALPAMRLVEALLQKGNADEATAVAMTAARRNPSSAATVIALARAWAAGVENGSVGMAEELLKIVTNIQQQLPGEDRTALIQAQLLAQKGQKPESSEILRKLVARAPAPPEDLLLAAAALSARFSMGLEEQCFEHSEQAHGLSAPLALARAMLRAINGHAADGLALFDDMAKRSGKSDEMPWRLARAKYLDASGNPSAREAWIALADAYPNDVSVQQAVVTSRSVSGDWETAQRAIDRLRKLTGEDGLAWRLAQAALMVQVPRNEDDYAKGSVLLNEIIRSYPQMPEPHVLLAIALVHLKRPDSAIEHLTTAARLNPASITISLQLAALLQSQGDYDRVRQEMERVTPRLHTAQQRRQAALLLAQQGETERAIAVLQAGAADGGPSLFLAALYRQHREFDKAEAIIKKLLETPDLLTIQFAASLYAARGRRADAEHALAALDAMKLDPGAKEMAWASFYVEIGDFPQAVKRYTAATQQAPANGIAWHALATCQVIVGQFDDAGASISRGLQLAPASPALAAIQSQWPLLRQSADQGDLLPVVISIMRDPSHANTSLELLQIMASGRESADMERLSASLQQLAERHPDSLQAQLQLAQCYWNMGRRADAISTAQRAMSAFPSEADAARVTVDLCAAARRWQEMLSAAENWKKRLGDDQSPADLAAARAQIGLKRFDAAIAQLQPYLAIFRSEPQKHVNLLATCCVAMSNAGRSRDAEQLLWPLAEKSSTWRVRWIQVAMEMQDAKEASAWLERVAPAVLPDEIDAQVMLAEAFDTLGSRAHEAALTQRGTEIFTRLAGMPNAPARALLAAGMQAERLGDLPAAEARYRRALNADANQFIALNNLAMVIVNRNGDAKEAVAMAARAVELQPRQANVHDTLATARAKAGDAAGAARAMRTAVLLEPDNALWRVRLAQYLLNAGDLIEADNAVKAIESQRLDVRSLPAAAMDQLEAIRKSLKERH